MYTKEYIIYLYSTHSSRKYVVFIILSSQGISNKKNISYSLKQLHNTLSTYNEHLKMLPFFTNTKEAYAKSKSLIRMTKKMIVVAIAKLQKTRPK